MNYDSHLKKGSVGKSDVKVIDGSLGKISKGFKEHVSIYYVFVEDFKKRFQKKHQDVTLVVCVCVCIPNYFVCLA